MKYILGFPIKFLKQKQFDHIEVKTQYCFRKCGNGCVVFAVPEERFYIYVNRNNIQQADNLRANFHLDSVS